LLINYPSIIKKKYDISFEIIKTQIIGSKDQINDLVPTSFYIILLNLLCTNIISGPTLFLFQLNTNTYIFPATFKGQNSTAESCQFILMYQYISLFITFVHSYYWKSIKYSHCWK